MVIIINLYEKNETDFSHNGFCVLQPIEAMVTEELNGDYSLKLTMPRGFPGIECEQIVKVPTPKSDQLFRVYNLDVDMLGNPVYYARHIFYDLLDYFIEDTRPTGNGALAIAKILEGTPFSGNSDIEAQGTAYYQMMSPVKAILGADNAFVNVWGGEVERDNFKVRLKNRIGEDRGVSIRYRKNLTGLRLQTDLSGVYTKIMPTGLKENGQTLLKLPELYVTSPLVENYTHVKTTRIHYGDIQVDENTTEEQVFEKLRNAATLEFENGLDKPSITATVEFIPLQETQEYKNFAVLERVYLGDTVSVYHEDLKIDLQAKVTSYEFDALSKRYNKVMIGNVQIKYGETQKKYVQQVNAETTTALEQAIINATLLITGNSGGYVVFRPAEKPQEILIMDTPDVNTAQKVWRWNLSGLGYSSTGVNGPFALAMTMDGAIVADFIAAGTINGALIKAGSVEAGSLSQSYKKSVTDAITGVQTSVTQAFQAADGKLSSTIASTYVTKNDASSTYATKTALTQTANEISTEVSKKVNNSEFGTKITQNAYNVQIAWNNISEIIQFVNAALRIYDGTGSGKQLLMKLDKNGEGFYRDGSFVGKIGTNVIKSDVSKRGLVFNLDEGNYMTWASRDNPSDDTYTMKMTYCRDSSALQKGINFSDNLYMHNWKIYDTAIQSSSDERLKKEISDSNVDALAVINALSCKEFKWKQDDRFEELGFIAQQVKEVNPKFVGEKIIDGETYYTLDLLAIVPYLVKAIQELTEKIYGPSPAIAMFSAEAPEYQPPKPVEVKFKDLGDGQIEIFKEEST